MDNPKSLETHGNPPEVERHHADHAYGHREREERHDPSEGAEMPLPTAWPLVAALGVMLVALGIVTSLFVSLVGFLLGLSGAIGWFRGVFPHPQHEFMPFVEHARRAAPIKVSPRSVGHLTLGEEGHRSQYPMHVHRYSSGILGGLAGGAAMAVLACLYGLVAQHSIWYPINLLAAAGLPSMTDATPQTLNQFHLGAFLVALVSHAVLSILIGMLYTVLLPMLPARREWLWGGIVTPLIWTALLVPMFNVVDPLLAQKVNWFWFVICQVSFGLVGGFVIFKQTKVETMQSWSLAARLGMHGLEADRKD